MVEIRVPTLLDRKEDLPLLQRSFISKFAAQYGKTVRGLTPRAQILLARHSWPGNVRELENVIGHACIMVIGDTIDVRDLPEYLWDSNTSAAVPAAGRSDAPASAAGVGSLEEQERRLIIQALETAGGNQSQAARLLRVGRDALRYKLKKHSIGAV
jgi:DNA-binding NtrC family response regulator